VGGAEPRDLPQQIQLALEELRAVTATSSSAPQTPRSTSIKETSRRPKRRGSTN
jgi:hypothetical protein